MSRIQNYLLVALTCCTLSVFGQDDKVNLDLNTAKSSKASGGATFNDINIKLSFVSKTGIESRLVFSPEFGLLNISNTGSVADSASLKTIGINIGFHTVLGQKTLFSISAAPLLASDLAVISGNDFRVRTDAMVLFNADKKFAYGFGIGYQYQFSGAQLLPLVVMIWHITDNITLSGPLPLIPHVDFKLDDKLTVGLGLKGDYSSYRLSASAYNNRYIQYSDFNFGFNAKYKASKNWLIGGFLGAGTRRIDVYNSNQTIPLRIFGWNVGGGSHIPSFDQRYKGAAFNLSIAYRI